MTRISPPCEEGDTVARFFLPTFNLTCNIVAPPTPGVPAPGTLPYRLAGQVCALVYGQRVNVASTGGTASQGFPLFGMNLLLPPLTDIRGPQDTTTFDVVEVPAGSGRWYWCFGVDDIGKGWTNEHRTAGLLAIAASWVPPYA
jgi:hypothetical protein